ncbi:MAG: DUF58 domain-containing protein [Chloroflexi bacterium]|nr:DUF58 domain-containing protein [Chloroflexota bacterium]
MLTLTEGWLVSFGILGILGLVLGQGLLVGLGALVVLTWLVAWGWNRASLSRVTFEREVTPLRAFVGETVEVRLRITNRKSLPVPWIRIEENFPFRLRERGKPVALRLEQGTSLIARATSLARYERVTWHFTLECGQRGLHRFGPARVMSGDVFGFFTSERAEPGQMNVLVYPNTVPLPALGMPAHRPFGEVKGGLPFYEDPTRLRGLREYTPDDPLRWVDWKATARAQAMRVRVFDPSVAHNLIVFQHVDTMGRESGRWGYSPMLLERGVTAAASIARWALEQRYSVGFATNGVSPLTDQPIRVPSSRSPQQLAAVLEALALVGPFSRESMQDFVSREIHRIPLGATLVVVTASLTPEGVGMLRDLRRRGHRTAVVWVSDRRFDIDVGPGITVYQVGDALARLESEAPFRGPSAVESVGSVGR